MDATCLCHNALLEIAANRVLPRLPNLRHRQGGRQVLGYGVCIPELPCPRASLKDRPISKLLSVRSSVLAFARRNYIYCTFANSADGEQELHLRNAPGSATEAQQRLDRNEDAKALEDTEDLATGKERIINDAMEGEHSVTGNSVEHHAWNDDAKGTTTSDEAVNVEREFPDAPTSTTDHFVQQHGYDREAKASGKDTPKSVTEETKVVDANGILEPGYTGLFVRLLGLDTRPEDRETAIQALWSHSMGGRNCVDEIMQFPGCLTLVVSLLVSERQASVEAAAGLLRNISAINVHRSALADAGAIEEITGILTRRKITSEVKEQLAYILWNLSVEERNRGKIATVELLPVLFEMLGSSKDAKTEAAAGVIANLTLSDCHHSILVEAGVISKMANLIKDVKSSKVARQEARNALLELARNGLFRLAILEEGLVPVPLIGASAYQSFKPLLDKAPMIPDNVKVDSSSNVQSPFGAKKMLLGLQVNNGFEIDDSTRLMLESQARQQFLTRIGVSEKGVTGKASKGQSNPTKITLMPWWDGISRLVLILGLEDATVAKLAAQTVADIAITEEIRNDIHKAGAIGHLVRLLGSGDEAATESAASALERLAISYKIRRSIDAHGAVPALVSVLNASNAPPTVKEKVVAALVRLSQTGEEMKAMIQSGAVPGLKLIMDSTNSTTNARKEAQDILEEIAGKGDPRDKIVASNGVPSLIQILESGSPPQKEKAACVLENLASNKKHAEGMIEAGVESALTAALKVDLAMEEGSDIGDVIAIAEREEILSSLVAATRLLDKLLLFDKIRNLLNCKDFAVILANILRADVPLYVKDWVSACLLKLEKLAGILSEVGIPTDIEITIHDTIPRLIIEIGSTSSLAVQERAVEELRDLISHGVLDYVTAIADSGGIFPLVDLLDKGTSRAKAAALAILYNISMNEENHPAILAAGATPYLERMVRSEMPEWKLALYLLRAFPSCL